MTVGKRPFDVRGERRAAGLLVSVTGEIDLYTAPRISAELAAYEGPGGTLVLDLREVTFMGSAGLGLIVDAQRRARERSFRFAVAIGGASDVRRILDISGMASSVELVDDPDALLA